VCPRDKEAIEGITQVEEQPTDSVKGTPLLESMESSKGPCPREIIEVLQSAAHVELAPSPRIEARLGKGVDTDFHREKTSTPPICVL